MKSRVAAALIFVNASLYLEGKSAILKAAKPAIISPIFFKFMHGPTRQTGTKRKVTRKGFKKALRNFRVQGSSLAIFIELLSFSLAPFLLFQLGCCFLVYCGRLNKRLLRVCMHKVDIFLSFFKWMKYLSYTTIELINCAWYPGFFALALVSFFTHRNKNFMQLSILISNFTLVAMAFFQWRGVTVSLFNSIARQISHLHNFTTIKINKKKNSSEKVFFWDNRKKHPCNPLFLPQ